MSPRLIPALTVLALTVPVAACSDDEPRPRAAGTTPETGCPTAPAHAAESPLRSVARVDGVLYGVGTSGIDRLDGATPTRIYDEGPDLDLELVASYDGDLIVAANPGRTDPAPHVFRLTTDGDVVWDHAGPGAVVREPDPVISTGDAFVSLDTGKEVDWDDPVDLDEYVLEHEGRDYSLYDYSADARVYLDIRGGVAITDPSKKVLQTMDGSAAVCGDWVYALSADRLRLTTYRLGDDGLEEVGEVVLPKPATQTAVRTTEGAVLLEVGGRTWVVSD
ncbi:hypothetical protein ACFJIY_05790 [Pimelobacter simplex]|uniref:hypothetical protein n=1 Tax=Nocardioides simplex TaxID=2045 RepID=UPI003672B29A